MSTKEDLPYLRHMLDAISCIEEYTSNMTWEEFKQKRLVQDGVIRQLSIIGEAARRVSAQIQQAYPEIPWSDIIGMRHKLIHDYFQVDVVEVWKTTISDVPILKQQLKSIWATIINA